MIPMVLNPRESLERQKAFVNASLDRLGQNLMMGVDKDGSTNMITFGFLQVLRVLDQRLMVGHTGMYKNLKANTRMSIQVGDEDK